MARPSSTIQDPVLLSAALEGFELQKKRIDEQIASIRAALSGRKVVISSSDVAVSAAPSAPSSSASSSRRKRVLSEEARLRIAAAQKKRWANFRKGKKSE